MPQAPQKSNYRRTKSDIWLAIPALALVPENGWIVACGLVIIERVGKAVKKPAKNTLVSFASSEIGQGKGFAYQEFLDQLGAFLGPVTLLLLHFTLPMQRSFRNQRSAYCMPLQWQLMLLLHYSLAGCLIR